MCAECVLHSTQADLHSYLEVSVLNEYGADLICVQSVLAWISICGLDMEQISSASKGITIPLAWKFIMDEHSGLAFVNGTSVLARSPV